MVGYDLTNFFDEPKTLTDGRHRTLHPHRKLLSTHHGQAEDPLHSQ